MNRKIVLVLLGATVVAEAQEKAPVVVIKVGVDLIQIDASITDRWGRAVGDLKPGDFTLEVDGKKQPVENLMFFGASSAATTTTDARLLPESPGEQIKPDQTIVFLVDDLNMSFHSMYLAKLAMIQFAKERGLGDAKTGVRLASSEKETVRLTRSLERFQEALEDVHYNMRSAKGASSAASTGQNTALADLRSRLIDVTAAQPNTLDQVQYGPMLRDLGEGSSAGQLNPAMLGGNFQQRVYALLTTINTLRSVPGRKSVVFVSEGFDFGTERRSLGVGSPFPSLFGDHDVDAALRMLAEVANRASVVLYTIDPSGLVYDGPDAETMSAPPPGSERQGLLARWDAQGTLQRLAADTGGLSVFNRNDLKGGLRDVVRDQASYYLIGFEPPQAAFAKDSGKPKFHRIKLSVSRPDVRVRTRAGFYGVTDKDVIARAPLMSPNDANGREPSKRN